MNNRGKKTLVGYFNASMPFHMCVQVSQPLSKCSQFQRILNAIEVETIVFQKYLKFKKRLLEMSSVAENNRIIPAIDKLDN